MSNDTEWALAIVYQRKGLLAYFDSAKDRWIIAGREYTEPQLIVYAERLLAA